VAGATDLHIDFLKAAVLFVACVSAATDFLYQKIYNWLTLPAILLGLFAQTWFFGLAGLGQAALGCGIGLLAYGWMYAIGVMGAGDVKLLMALGALGGALFVADTAILGIVLGGIMAAFVLLSKGRIRDFSLRIARFILTVTSKHLTPEFPQIDHRLKMPFGIAIAAASVWVLFDNPLTRWGLRLWG